MSVCHCTKVIKIFLLLAHLKILTAIFPLLSFIFLLPSFLPFLSSIPFQWLPTLLAFCLNFCALIRIRFFTFVFIFTLLHPLIIVNKDEQQKQHNNNNQMKQSLLFQHIPIFIFQSYLHTPFYVFLPNLKLMLIRDSGLMKTLGIPTEYETFINHLLFMS